jgi:amino acid adenylation domain-containing protein
MSLKEENLYIDSLVQVDFTEIDNGQVFCLDSKCLCVHQLFEAQTWRTPDAVAVVFENQQLTYRQLNNRANQLAHYLLSLGVGPDVLVGICMERSVEMVVGVLGILKAGGAYVPLDPTYPIERLAFIMKDTQIQLNLTQERLVNKLPAHKAQVICLDSEWELIAQRAQSNPTCEATPDNLAYVIYTSGSTGQPKGVMIPHRGICNQIYWRQRTFGLTAVDKVLQTISLSFDPSVWQIFWPLSFGAQLIMARPGGHQDTSYLVKTIAEQQITVIALVPSMLSVLLSDSGIENCKCLRHITSGGEALPVSLIESFFARLDLDNVLVNCYGPTEASIDATFYRCQRAISNSIAPIGCPITNVEIYILNEELQPVGVGEEGELHIGGIGLARGYLNRPELTAQKFIANPFERSRGAGSRCGSRGAGRAGEVTPSLPHSLTPFSNRLYKTGDLARYLPDGNIEFLGRIDDQVKIRGFRIELGEIESVIGSHPDVLQTTVVAIEDVLGHQRLIAYIVAHQEQTPTINELRYFLQQKLPDYMMPAAFVFMDTLPLTPNGKIDRRALKAPDLYQQDIEKTFVAPTDELELQLTHIWEKFLGIQPIGVKDNFFALGGNSLLAMRLLAEISSRFNKSLPLTMLFSAPTIEQLVPLLRAEEWAALESSLVSIQPLGFKPPFFFINSISYAKKLAPLLGSEQPFYGLNIFGLTSLLEKDIPNLQIEKIAELFIKDMQAIQPNGPYLLGAYCNDSKLAFEMAQQLHQQGQKVALLALIDAIWDAPNLGLYAHWYNLCEFGLNYFLEKGKNKLNFLKEELVIFIKSIKGKFYSTTGSTLPSHLQDVNLLKAFYQASDTYIPQVYPGYITLFLSSELRLNNSPKLESLADGGFEIHEIFGYHHSMFEQPYVLALAEKLRVCIDKAQKEMIL